jgi:hypothetical protein
MVNVSTLLLLLQAHAEVPVPADLVLADFPFDAPLMGAVALAIDAVNGDRSHHQ